MDEIAKEFFLERRESLESFDHDIRSLIDNPREHTALGEIFRSIHTFNEGRGLVGFGKLEAVAYVGENLLSKLRDGVINFNPEHAHALLATVDAVRYMLGQIEVTGQIGDRDFTDLVNLLTRLNESPAVERKSDASPASSPADMTTVAGRPHRVVVAPKTEAMVPPSATPGLNHAVVASAVLEASEPVNAIEATSTFQDIFENRGPTVTDNTLRDDVDPIDHLIKLVGELKADPESYPPILEPGHPWRIRGERDKARLKLVGAQIVHDFSLMHGGGIKECA